MFKCHFAWKLIVRFILQHTIAKYYFRQTFIKTQFHSSFLGYGRKMERKKNSLSLAIYEGEKLIKINALEWCLLFNCLEKEMLRTNLRSPFAERMEWQLAFWPSEAPQPQAFTQKQRDSSQEPGESTKIHRVHNNTHMWSHKRYSVNWGCCFGISGKHLFRW